MDAVKKYLPWVLIVYVAVVFLPSDFFKLTGAEVSVRMFSYIAAQTGVGLFEPAGRYVIGIAEIVAVVLLIMPAQRFYGAVLALILMIGAVLTHLLFIGITVVDAQGEIVDSSLFMMAVGVIVASLILIRLERGGEAQTAIEDERL